MKVLKWFLASMLALILVLLAVPLFAGEAPEMVGPPAPQGRRVVASDALVGSHKPEPHFGLANILVTGAIGVSAGFDIRTTLQARSLAGTYEFHSPDGYTKIVTVSFHEKTGFYRAAAMKGSSGHMALRKAEVFVPIAIASHYMRRSKSKGIRIAGWALAGFAVGVQTQAALGNQREITDINKLLVP